MTLTPQQHAERRKALGASDIAAIMGESKWKTPEDIRLEKLGLVPPDAGNKVTQAGSLFEASVLDWAEGELGPLTRGLRVPHPNPDIPLVASLDALCRVDGLPVEAKTAGLFGPLHAGWGAAGTDSIPDYYILQAHAQMACTETDTCHVPAFLGGRGFTLFRVRRNEEIIVAIEEEAARFWKEHVMGDTPCAEPPSMDVLCRRDRQPGVRVAVEPELIQAWMIAADARKDAEQAEKDAKKMLLAALGAAEGSTIIEGVGNVSFMAQSRAGGLDVDALRAAHPDLDFDEFQKPATRFRVLRHHKWKAPKVTI